MTSARKRTQIVERRKVLGLREIEGCRATANTPEEGALHQVDVVQPIAKRLVLPGGWMGAERVPKLGIGPELVIEHVAENGIHGRD